jgi:hypothetical protein
MGEDAASAEPTASLSQRWRTGAVGFPTLVVMLLVLGGAGLAAASIGGWGSVAVLVILMVAFLGLITSWTVSG